MSQTTITIITHEGDRHEVSTQLSAFSEFLACISHSVASESASEIDIGDLDIDTDTFRLIHNYFISHDFQSTTQGNETFFSDIDDDRLLRLCIAAQSLGISELLRASLMHIAQQISDKDVRDMEEMMEIEIDVNPRKEAFMKVEASWAVYRA